MMDCKKCGFYDHDYGGCSCPSGDRWYACPIENKKPENQKALAELSRQVVGTSVKKDCKYLINGRTCGNLTNDGYCEDYVRTVYCDYEKENDCEIEEIDFIAPKKSIPCTIHIDNDAYVDAVIKVRVPKWQIGQEASVYFKDTMNVKGITEAVDFNESDRIRIGDEVYVHGFVDEIRKDVMIIRNEGGYFSGIKSEVIKKKDAEM